jgi:hypothetical protein
VNPYDYICKHVNVKLLPSKIHGVGVFAIRDIEEGEDLFVNWKGESGEYYITETELNSLNEEIRSHLYQMFGFKRSKDEWLFQVILNKDCHWIFKTPQHWVNSCSYEQEPNINLDILKAIKRIKSGEELLSKYGKYEKFKSNTRFQII